MYEQSVMKVVKSLKKRIIVGVTGASGIPVAIRVLQLLRMEADYESHLVISESGKITIGYESDYSISQIESMADHIYDTHEIGAAIASGTFCSEGMIIVPCSMKTVAGIANGYSASLLLRAVDVMLKERKKLILMIRESPLSSIHTRNMHCLADAGVELLPLVMTFYNQPKTIEDMIHHLACKALDRFDIAVPHFRRWMDSTKQEQEVVNYENVN